MATATAIARERKRGETLDTRAMPLANAIHRWQAKTARQVIRRVLGLRKVAAVARVRFTRDEIEELARIIRVYGIRSVRQSAGIALRDGDSTVEIPEEIVSSFLADKEVKLKEWLEGTRRELSQVVRQVIYDAQREDPRPSPTQVAARLYRRSVIAEGGPFNEARALRIARTETASAENFGLLTGLAAAGFSHIEWITISDDRARDSHRANGVVIEIGDKYANGLKYPGDPDGPPEEVINCRCRVVGARKAKRSAEVSDVK